MIRDLMQPVWKIPKGKVATYGEVARAAGYPRHARQVARALNQARGGIPWQRVVGAGGAIKLRGASGFEQRLRLEHEGVTFRGKRIRMREHEFKFGAAATPARGSAPTSRPVRKRSRRTSPKSQPVRKRSLPASPKSPPMSKYSPSDSPTSRRDSTKRK